jgi:uridine kinase
MFVKKREPFVVGVAGGISSGKSSCCKKIIDELKQLNADNKKNIVIISLDSFYKKLSTEDRTKAELAELNLDHPDAVNEQLAYDTLLALIRGKPVQIPVYCKKTYNTTGDVMMLDVKTGCIPDVLIIEGILVFYYPKIRELCQMKLFVDCDADTRLSRRVLRDMKDFHRTLDHILTYYQKFVKPAFEEFCLPTKKYADVIIPRGAENTVALNLIVQHINDYLNSSGATWGATTNTTKHLESEESAESESSSSPSKSHLIVVTNGSPPQQSSSSSSTSSCSPSTTPSKRLEISTRPH